MDWHFSSFLGRDLWASLHYLGPTTADGGRQRLPSGGGDGTHSAEVHGTWRRGLAVLYLYKAVLVGGAREGYLDDALMAGQQLRCSHGAREAAASPIGRVGFA